MIFSDETRPTIFTFANHIGMQTDGEQLDGSIPDELARTMSFVAPTISSGCAPTMSSLSCHGNLILMVRPS